MNNNLNTKIELLIDNRETKIKEHFKNKDYVTIENLELGDIIFKYNNEIVLIIERKTLSDLAASIKDGRYNEQKKRLLSNYAKDYFNLKYKPLNS